MLNFIKPGFKGIMLNITDDCNLRCKYCFVNKSPNYMPFAVAKDTVDLLLKINKDKDITPSLTFFGGEPTLCWDTIIVPLVEYTKSINAEIIYSITSNGILLTEEKLKYMAENNIGLLFSMDGIKECQDINRPLLGGQGSFDILESKIPLILKYLPGTTFRATLYPETCHTLYDSIKFAEKAGFKSLFVVPDDNSSWTEEQKISIKEQLDKYVDDYIKNIDNLNTVIDVTPITDMFRYISIYRQVLDTNADYSGCMFPMCGLGIDYASVNYEGKIFACQELPTNNSITNKYYIGDIYNGINVTQHAKLIEEYKKIKIVCLNEELCTNCNIKPICNRLVCHANSYLLTKTLNKKTEIKCFWDNLIFEEASKIINALGKNETFIEIYLKKVIYEQQCC